MNLNASAVLTGPQISLGLLTIGDRIGGGGYGEVFKASHAHLSTPLAIKILNPSSFHSDLVAVRERFFREAEILMNLRHPNICSIYSVGEDNGRPFILMEYFEGFDLDRARVAAGPPEPAAVLHFVELVALALGHAHQRNVVHRDVKPSNLLTRRGDARVVDFGIAQIRDPEGERFTKVGGTPVGNSFAAPELIDNPRLLDPRCDIYSLGACWFWLLTGSTPRGRNWEGLLRGIQGMTPHYESVLLKTLDDSSKRYQTMEDLAADVRSIRDGRNPNAIVSPDLEDDAALLLGAIFEQYVPSNEPASTYRLEQQLSGRLTRFAYAVGLRTLRRKEMVEEVEVEDSWNQEVWTGLRPTKSGEEWVDQHRSRVAQLLLDSRPAIDPPTSGDEIPF